MHASGLNRPCQCLSCTQFDIRRLARRRSGGQPRCPTRIAMLEMQRIGWAWPATYTVANDHGQTITLACAPPKAFVVAAADAVRRQLARAMARCCQCSNGSRVAYEPAIAAIKAEHMSARQRACARALFCSAVWTGQERHKYGYVNDDACELCDSADSVHHSLWGCTSPEAGPKWVIICSPEVGTRFPSYCSAIAVCAFALFLNSFLTAYQAFRTIDDFLRYCLSSPLN